MAVHDNQSPSAISKLIATNNKITERPLCIVQDVVICAFLLACTPVAILLPQSRWTGFCRFAARLLPASFQSLASRVQIAEILNLEDDDTSRILRDTMAAHFMAILDLLRGIVRGPSYDLIIEGQEHLDKALAKNRGAVIWLADLVFANDVAKIALSKNGYWTSHLSRPEHGFSDTWFGVRYLNLIRQKYELRFLKERIVFTRENPSQAGEKMQARLAENGIVSILACASEGRSVVEADFLGHRLHLASGAPRLGFKNNCDVLPVFVEPGPEYPRFKVIIGEPLRMESREKDTAILEAASDYMNRLQAVVERHPHIWRSWPFLLPGKKSAMQNTKAANNPLPGPCSPEAVQVP